MTCKASRTHSVWKHTHDTGARLISDLNKLSPTFVKAKGGACRRRRCLPCLRCMCKQHAERCSDIDNLAFNQHVLMRVCNVQYIGTHRKALIQVIASIKSDNTCPARDGTPVSFCSVPLCACRSCGLVAGAASRSFERHKKSRVQDLLLFQGYL